MPNRNNYPVGFNVFSKPWPSHRKPEKTLKEYKQVKEFDGETSFTKDEIVEIFKETGADYFDIDAEQDYDGGVEVNIQFMKIIETPNTQYDRQYRAFEKADKKYKTKMVEWTKLKKRWDAEVKAEREEGEKAMLKMLKKKYE